MQLEDTLKKKRRRGMIQDILLTTLYIGAGLSIAAVAPNAMRILKYIEPVSLRKRKPDYVMKAGLKRLLERGWVVFETIEGKKRLLLTPAGRRELNLPLVYHVQNQGRKRKWDGRWRIVVFDIGEKYRRARDKIRLQLEAIGFHQLQRSVWIYPYDCEEMVMLLRTDVAVGRNLLYMIVEYLENDARLRERFHLPQL